MRAAAATNRPQGAPPPPPRGTTGPSGHRDAGELQRPKCNAAGSRRGAASRCLPGNEVFPGGRGRPVLVVPTPPPPPARFLPARHAPQVAARCPGPGCRAAPFRRAEGRGGAGPAEGEGRPQRPRGRGKRVRRQAGERGRSPSPPPLRPAGGKG